MVVEEAMFRSMPVWVEPPVISIPALLATLVVSTLKTLLPLLSRTDRAVVEEVRSVIPPQAETFSICAPVEEAILNKSEVWPLLPCKASMAAGVEVLIPTLPLTATVKKEAPVVEEICKIGSVWADVDATIVTVPPVGVEELIIKDLAVLSHKKLDEPLNAVPLANWMALVPPTAEEPAPPQSLPVPETTPPISCKHWVLVKEEMAKLVTVVVPCVETLK